MKLLAKLLTATLSAGQPQDVMFELVLENDSSKPVTVCTKDIPWQDGLGYHGFGATFAASGLPVRSVFRPINPAWGPPSPPYLATYLERHGQTLQPGQQIRSQVQACLLPRPPIPSGNKVLSGTLHPPQGTDVTTLALIVFETRCDELQKALKSNPSGALYGRPAAALFHGQQDVTFQYVEQPGFGFAPAQALRLAAPAISLKVP